jgi:hypothetical protein
MLTKINGMCEGEDTIRLVRETFTWVASATRPLTLAELSIALAIELGTECLDSVEPFWVNSDIDDLTARCRKEVPFNWLPHLEQNLVLSLQYLVQP